MVEKWSNKSLDEGKCMGVILEGERKILYNALWETVIKKTCNFKVSGWKGLQEDAAWKVNVIKNKSDGMILVESQVRKC